MDADQPKFRPTRAAIASTDRRKRAKPTRSGRHGVVDLRTTEHAKFQQRDKSRQTA